MVDDEVFVRMDLVDALAAAGYSTREAGCAAEAIEVLEHQSDIAVLFTDSRGRWTVGIGPLRAKEVASTVIVISSGNFSPAVDDSPSGAQFLAKPYSRQDLIRTLELIEIRLAAT